VPKFVNNRVRQSVAGTLAPRTRRSGSGQVDALWRGVRSLEAFDFIAVGGGGRGGNGNWTNGIYGAGGGGGGLAAGTVSSPVSGTVTVPAWGNQANCFGNTANTGSNGGESQPQYSGNAPGGARSTAGGGTGGSGGKVNQTGFAGPTSAITGTTTNYGGGGGGAPTASGGSFAGGAGGGGAGADPKGIDGTVNTGGGGGGSRFSNQVPAGGSGIVIISYPDDMPEFSSIGVGLTYTVALINGFRRYTFTAGTGTVTV
jgi:hypothetical protein